MRVTFKAVWQAKDSVVAVAQTLFFNLAIQAANLGCGVISARALGPSGRGTMIAIIMWPQLMECALSLGTPLSFIYYVKKRPELERQLSGASIVLSLVCGLLGSLFGALVIIPRSLHAYPAATIHFAQMMVFLAPIGLGAVTLLAQIQSSDAIGKYNVFRFLAPITTLVLLCVLRLTTMLTPYTTALVYLLAGLPGIGWLFYQVWKVRRPVFTRLLEPTRLLLGYGLRAWGIDLLGTVANQVDRVLVVTMLSSGSMGLYVVAQSAVGLLAVIPSAVKSVLLPRAAGRTKEEIAELTGRAARMTVFLMVLASAPPLLGGRFLLHMVYGDNFTAVTEILPFLVLEAIFDGVTMVLSQAFLAAGYPGIVTLLEGAGVLSAIPLVLLFIPIWGLKGAAAALLLATVVRFGFVMCSFPYRLGLVPPNVFIGYREAIAFFRTRQLVPTGATGLRTSAAPN